MNPKWVMRLNLCQTEWSLTFSVYLYVFTWGIDTSFYLKLSQMLWASPYIVHASNAPKDRQHCWSVWLVVPIRFGFWHQNEKPHSNLCFSSNRLYMYLFHWSTSNKKKRKNYILLMSLLLLLSEDELWIKR